MNEVDQIYCDIKSSLIKLKIAIELNYLVDLESYTGCVEKICTLKLSILF